VNVDRTKRSPDPRAERSRHLLQQALLELAAERPLSEISVSEVAAAATINRATFYAHYRHLDDVIVDALRREFDALGVAATQLGEQAAGELHDEVAPPSLVRLFTHLDERRALYQRVLGPDGSVRFISWMRDRSVEHVRLALELRGLESEDAVPVDVHADFITGGLLGVVTSWLDAEDPRDAPDMAQLVWRLLRALATGSRVD
jgi:AcrR family transcriptional regulator